MNSICWLQFLETFFLALLVVLIDLPSLSTAPATTTGYDYDDSQNEMYLEKNSYMNESNSKPDPVNNRKAVSMQFKGFQKFAGFPETGSKGHLKLSYNIRKNPNQLEDKKEVDEMISKALKVWSDVTNVKFINAEQEQVDIDIRFEEGTNPLQVATYSDVKDSINIPFYREDKPTFNLLKDDMRTQALYDRLLPADDDGPPDLCQDPSIDAATTTEDRRMYVFKGLYYWEVLENGIADGYPRKIKEDWGGLPGNIDAALTGSDGNTFFFKNDQFWRFRNKAMDSGYPQPISVGFKGIPSNLDATFVWRGLPYFFKGSNYWRYSSSSDPPVDSSYPQPISSWDGLPSNIDAALQYTNKKTYFFKGKIYYRFNDGPEPNDPPYPRSTSEWWFGCKA